MRLASCMSLGWMVTLLACREHKLVSSKRETKYASEASCRATSACDSKRRSARWFCAISRTSLWKGILRRSRSVDFWYLCPKTGKNAAKCQSKTEQVAAKTLCQQPKTNLRISRRAIVPGLYLCFFLIISFADAAAAEAEGIFFFLGAACAFCIICLTGADPPVDLRAVCLVRAMYGLRVAMCAT